MAVTATVQAMPASAMPGTTIPATVTPVTLTVQSEEEDSADDLPISKYLMKFLQQEDVPQQDLTETQHVTEFPEQEDEMETQQAVTECPQQEVSEPTPKKIPIPEEQPPKKRSKIDIPKSKFINPEIHTDVQSPVADVQPMVAAVEVQHSTSAASDVQPSSSAAAADVQPST